MGEGASEDSSVKEQPHGGYPRSERRRYRRYDFSAPVFLRVLIEEETFNPLRFPGRTINISAGGMLVEASGMAENYYRTLIRRPRMVRVHMNVPEADGEVVFFGRIVWYDYRRTSEGEVCRMGIAFDKLDEKAKAVLDRILQELASERSAS